MAIFVLTIFVLRIQSLDIEREHIKIVRKTSRDRLLVWYSSRLSNEISGVLGRETAVRRTVGSHNLK